MERDTSEDITKLSFYKALSTSLNPAAVTKKGGTSAQILGECSCSNNNVKDLHIILNLFGERLAWVEFLV